MAWYQPIPLFFGNIFSVDRAGKGLSNSTIYITYIISPFCLSCGIFGPFLTLLYTQTPFLALSGEFFFRIKFADSSLKGGGGGVASEPPISTNFFGNNLSVI